MTDSNYMKLIREDLDIAESRVQELEKDVDKLIDLLKRSRNLFLENNSLVEEIELLLVKNK